jgi:hypothetical protein
MLTSWIMNKISSTPTKKCMYARKISIPKARKGTVRFIDMPFSVTISYSPAY